MKARARALVAVSFLSVAAARFDADSPAKVSGEADRIEALPVEERQWLTEFVASIILPKEKNTFLALTDPCQREAFKLDFWARREKPDLPQPLGPGYRDRYEELWRLAEEKYGGWRQDTGRMVLRLGEPAGILKPRCGGEDDFHGVEVWTYNNLRYGGRRTARYIFYRRFPNGPYRVLGGFDREADVFTQNSCRRSFEELSLDCKMGNARCGPCEDRCLIYLAYRESQPRTMGDVIELTRLFKPIPVSTEGLERQLEPKYREWLDLARPLLSEEELSLFLQIPPKQKDEFIQKFWKSRS